MRLIKMFLFVLVGMFAVLTLISLVIPSNVKISRGIIINADSAKVQQSLSDVKDWNQWLPWITNDSGAIVQFSPVTNQPGSFIKWQGLLHNSAGTITLKEINPDMITALYQFKGMNDAEGGFRTRPVGTGNNTTEVLWFMDYQLKWYPWEKFYGIFMDHIIGPAFEKGLDNFKNFIETDQSIHS